MKKTVGLAFILGLLIINEAYARNVIEGEILFELTSDYQNDSDDRVRQGDDKSNTFVEIEPVFYVNMGEYWRINNHWRFRPVEDRGYGISTVGGNAYYGGTFYGKEDWISRDLHVDDYGIILEELEFQFEKNDFKFGIGKFNPEFGIAHDKKRYHGIYGVISPREYKLTEKWGFTVGGIFENFEFEGSAFFDDTTGLSNSAIKDRGRDTSRGGAGNTDRPNSFNVVARGNNLFTVEGLNYNFGFRYLATKRALEEDEKGYLGGLEYVIEVGNNGMIIPFIEYAYLTDYDGIDSRDTFYRTYSLTGLAGNWNIVLSNTVKKENEDNFSDIDDYSTQYSFGYKFECGLMFDFGGWHRKQTFKTNTLDIKRYDTLGGKISYMLEF
jgi:hypothetical protein